MSYRAYCPDEGWKVKAVLEATNTTTLSYKGMGNAGNSCYVEDLFVQSLSLILPAMVEYSSATRTNPTYATYICLCALVNLIEMSNSEYVAPDSRSHVIEYLEAVGIDVSKNAADQCVDAVKIHNQLLKTIDDPNLSDLFSDVVSRYTSILQME